MVMGTQHSNSSQIKKQQQKIEESENLPRHESANLFTGPSESTGPLCYNSYCFQLTSNQAGHPQLSQGPFVCKHKAQNNRAVDRLR